MTSSLLCETLTIKKHSPQKALLLSVLSPGGGQLYNKKKIKSGILFTTALTSLSLSAYYHNQYQDKMLTSYQNKKDQMVTIFVITYLYSVLDAYVDAHFYEYDQLKLNTSINVNNTLNINLTLHF